jgi:hypothetical protein
MVARVAKRCAGVTLVLIALLSGPCYGYADDLAKELQGAVSEIKQQAGITGPSDGLQAVAVSETPQVENQAATTPGQPSGAAVEILSHVTFPEGIEFPKEGEIVLEPTPTTVPDPQDDRQIVLPESEYRRPGSCEKNETHRVVITPGVAETRAYYDYLYLPEEFVPVDPEEVFGAGVNLEPVGPQSGEAVYVLMRVKGVPCVPYRRRITEAASYEDFGTNALRNYSKDQAGKGTLDIRMQQKLFGKKR